MIQKKSLKEAIQNPEIISVSGRTTGDKPLMVALEGSFRDRRRC